MTLSVHSETTWNPNPSRNQLGYSENWRILTVSISGTVSSLIFRYRVSTFRPWRVHVISSADPKVSSAELMVLLICPSSVVVVRRPSVNFCFKSLLLLQFLFDHSEFFTGETRHIVPPCNKAGISNFCLELQKLQKFQISWKRYSSFSSYSIILKFILEKLGI